MRFFNLLIKANNQTIVIMKNQRKMSISIYQSDIYLIYKNEDNSMGSYYEHQ